MITRKIILLVMLLAACVGQRESWNPLKNLISNIVEDHLLGCQLVLLTHRLQAPVVLGALRQVFDGLVIITALSDQHLLRTVYAPKTSKCRVVVFHFRNNNNNNNDIQELSVMERMGLWKLPDTRVLLVGGKKGVESSLSHPSLRNTIHCLYLAIHLASETKPPGPRLIPHPYHNASNQAMEDEVTVYRRCLYCKGGEHDIQLITRWNVSSGFHTDNLFLENDEQLQQLYSHKLRIVAVPYFPYMDFTRDSDEPGTTITAKYSIDTRLISTFASHLNFTYVMREDPNHAWGLEKDGVFTGMMGQLQREEADFCTIAGPSPGRLKVIDYLKGYPSDPMTVTSLKPSLLPQHLALIRPFTVMVWISVFACVVTSGSVVWTIHLASRKFAGGQNVKLKRVLLYSWGSLLEQSMKNPFMNVSTKVAIGWWLLFCFIITSAFKCSLIAHLTIQGKSRPPDTLDDLVASDGWKWATEPWLLKGVPYEYFAKHPDPVVKKIHNEMGVLDADDALTKILKGQFSLIDFENYITIIVASRYTDERGETPFYISKKTFSVMAAFGWGFRKGAPYYNRFQQLMSRLEDTGIIRHWTDEVMARRIRENRQTEEPFILKSNTATDYSNSNLLEVVLGMGHLQGAFYMLAMGYGMALVSVILENVHA